jgi:DNA invertase Pin-like site-specific DNA recombinase
VKAAIYLRQSSDPNNDQLGVTRQREDCTKLCEAKGWTPVEYCDNDTSASTRKPRPRYTDMLVDIRSGAIGAVVVWDLDRLHRRPIELEHFIELADQKHLALATVTGECDLGTDNGRLFARIKGAVARAEVERKTARMKRRYLQDAEAGRPHSASRNTAFGYTADNHLDPVTSAAVAAAYAGVLSGRSLYSIAKDWNAHGFTSARGKQWDASGARAVLMNPRNAGLRAHRGVVVAEATWPAIVDRDTFDGVVAKLSDPVRRQGAGSGRKYLLSGLARCGKCGHTVSSAIRQGRPDPRYHCKHCLGVTRKIEWVDDFVLSVVAERLSRSDAAELLTAPDRPDMAALRTRAAALREKQSQLAEDFIADRITREQMHTATASINRQLDEIDSATVDAGKSRVLDGVIAPGDRDAVRARLDGLDLDRRRAVIDLLLTVTILPGQKRGAFREDLVRIEWK